MKAKILFKTKSGVASACEEVLSFSFRKDAYLAYTILNAAVLADADIQAEDIAEVSLIIGDTTLHHGLIDSLEISVSGGRTIASVSSRSFTSLLCQNQLEPGIMSGVSINSLMESFYTIPYVTHENNSDTSSYICVEAHTTMWQNIVNLTYKLTGGYPYIRGTNCVRITQYDAPSVFTYDDSELLSVGTGISRKTLVSNFHMSDMFGEYGSYEYEDSDVLDAKIVRHKYFELDRQFLYDPDEALVYHDKDACRAEKRIFCTHKGYGGEDLSDIVSFGSVSSQRIAALTVHGDKNGIVTKVSVYQDKFSGV